MDKMLIGKRIRVQREFLQVTREQFSELVGISPQFLAEIENGKKGISAETLYKICEKGNASADYILFGELSENSKSPLVKAMENLPEEYHSIIETMVGSLCKQLNRDLIQE